MHEVNEYRFLQMHYQSDSSNVAVLPSKNDLLHTFSTGPARSTILPCQPSNTAYNFQLPSGAVQFSFLLHQLYQ